MSKCKFISFSFFVRPGRGIVPMALILGVFACTFNTAAMGAAKRQRADSTFVGNGGNAQDLDLGAALSVLNSTASGLDLDSKTLCECPDAWSENDICRVLREMSGPERKVCREALLQHAAELAALSGRDSDVRFVWAEAPITVKEGNAPERSVDAVTQPGKKTVIINRARFYELPLSFRVALLAHELMHLVRHDGRLIDDESPAKPFKNGRDFLDNLGAALALEANETGTITQGSAMMSVSKSRKDHWLTMNFGSVAHAKKTAQALIKSENSGLFVMEYTWRPENLGLQFSIEGQSQDSSVKSNTAIHVTESLSLYSLGVDYRVNPINRYLSRWNELFVTVLASLGSGSAKYKVTDGSVSLSDKSSVQTAKAGFRVYLPLMHGWWIIGGYDLRQVRYQYKSLKIKTIENQNILSLGGVYGF